MKIWYCKIGECDAANLAHGSDYPMRQAIAEAYKKITGEHPKFIFSGWAGKLTDSERQLVNPQTAASEDSYCLTSHVHVYLNGHCVQCNAELPIVKRPIASEDK